METAVFFASNNDANETALKQVSAGHKLISSPHKDVIANSLSGKQRDISHLLAPVDENSDEYLKVDLKLQIALNTTLIDHLNVKAITNPNLSVLFDRASADLQVLDAWIPLSHLSGKNTLENVCERGFDFGDCNLGYQVDVGSIKIDSYQGMNIVYVLCKVIVGNSVVVEDLAEGRFYVNAIRSKGFCHSADSLYVKTDQSDVYRNRYRIFHPSQILPCYIVRFATSSLIRRPPAADVDYSNNVHQPVVPHNVQKSIQDQIREIDQILKKEFADTAEDQVYEVTEKSMLFLQELAQEKMSIILAEEMLMRHQIQQIKALRDFVSNEYKIMSPADFCTFMSASNAMLTTGAAYGRRLPKALKAVLPDLELKGGIEISNNWDNLIEGGESIANSIIYGIVSNEPNAKYSGSGSQVLLEEKNLNKREMTRQPAVALRKHYSTVLKSTVFRKALYDQHIGKYLEVAEKEDNENNAKSQILSSQSLIQKLPRLKERWTM